MRDRGDAPLIEVLALTKHYGADVPLRVAQLLVGRTERVVLSGLDAAAAEVLMHLLTGAALPDTGEVRIAGRPTRDIPTETDWLASLDRFGLVSLRAVLLESLPTVASLALPLSLSIDPMPPELRRRVETLADEVGLSPARLDRPAAELTAAERVRVHLARAIAHGPEMLLLEHPTSSVSAREERRAIGDRVRQLSDARGVGWLALSDDADFARASGGRHLRLDPSGAISGARRGWTRFWWS